MTSRALTWTLAALLPLTAFAQERITLRDGTTFDGRMTGASERSITFRDNSGQMHQFDVDRVQSIQFHEWNRANSYGNNQDNYKSYPAPPPPPNNAGGAPGAYPASASMVLPAGTRIAVRTDEAIDARDATPQTSYAAQVAEDIIDPNGAVIIPRGSEARLVVRRLEDQNLALDLGSIRVNGQRYLVDTSSLHHQREGVGENKRTGEFVGGGAVLGTLLGAIAGGGKGAAIGALAGGAAGAGAEVATRGSEIKAPAETVLTFRLDRPLYMNPAQ